MTTPYQSRAAPFVRQRVYQKSRDLRASIPFTPLPHPLPSTFLLLPHNPRVPNAKNWYARPEFRSLRTGTLATQAMIDLKSYLQLVYLQEKKEGWRSETLYSCRCGCKLGESKTDKAFTQHQRDKNSFQITKTQKPENKYFRRVRDTPGKFVTSW